MQVKMRCSRSPLLSTSPDQSISVDYLLLLLLLFLWLGSRTGIVVRLLASHECGPGFDSGPVPYVGRVCFSCLALRAFFRVLGNFGNFEVLSATRDIWKRWFHSGNTSYVFCRTLLQKKRSNHRPFWICVWGNIAQKNYVIILTPWFPNLALGL